jgi:LysR family nitrogen assimilation transcriptional regulator
MAVSLGVALNVVLDVDALNIMLDLARRGEGATILTKPALHDYAYEDELCVRPIINPTISSTAMLVRSVDRPMTGAIRKLAHIIREEARHIRHATLA